MVATTSFGLNRSLNEPIIIFEDDAAIEPIFFDYIPLVEEKINRYGFLRLEPKNDKGETILKENQIENYRFHFSQITSVVYVVTQYLQLLQKSL